VARRRGALSTRLRASLGLALVATLAGTTLAMLPGASAAPAQAATHAAKVTVHDGPDGKHVAVIDTTLYVPPTATARHPAPAVLVTHGFGGSKDSGNVVNWARFLSSHGYVVLAWTAQGFGASSGCIRLDSAAYDVGDISALITQLLAPRPDVLHDARGPVVGMVGESYGGGIQPLLAEHDPRVRAIVPFWGWNSLQHALIPNDRIVPGHGEFDLQAPTDGVMKAEWVSQLFAAGNAQPAQGNGGCPQEKLAAGDPSGAAACPGFPTIMCQVYATVAAAGTLDGTGRTLLAGSSGASWISRLRTPTMLVQGESDTLFPLSEAIATYTALRTAKVPVAMIWSSSGHGGYPGQPGEGEFDSTDLEHGYISQRVLTWFDRWLRGAQVDTGPGFAYYRNWVPDGGKGSDVAQYAAAPAFPAQKGASYLLSGGGAMVAPGLAPSTGSAAFYRLGAPAYSETSNCTGPGASTPCPGSLDGIPANDVPLESASWTSTPLRADVDSVGTPTAHVHLSHVNGQDLIVFAKVYDVAPDGSSTLVNRLVAPVRVPNADLTKAVDIRLPAFAHRFPKGHAVRFTFAATDAAYSLGAATNLPDQITASFGALHDFGTSPYGQIKQFEFDPDMSAFTLPVPDWHLLEPYVG